MILFDNKKECSGCTACQSICPKNAILMKPDNLGFLYPKISNEICINCGLCKSVCAFNENYDKSDLLQNQEFYGARNKKLEEVEFSQSGAAFFTFSEWILENDGVVYGAGYGEHFKVIHKRATTKENRDDLRKSKYVQSDLQGIFIQVKEDLENKKLVLFSGTPCQVAGLKSFIKKKNLKLLKNLFLVDIVCHGVPSPKMWQEYLNYLENKTHKKITKTNFRDKKFGWHSHVESFEFDHTYTYTYTYLFYEHIMFRSSCGNCKFTNFDRAGDITISDFWGVEKTDKDFASDNKGCSLIMLNTQKGKALFENIKDDFNLIATTKELCVQPNLQHPTKIHPKREQFEKDYVKSGFVYVMKKYGNIGIRYWIKKTFSIPKRIIRKILRILKRFLRGK